MAPKKKKTTPSCVADNKPNKNDHQQPNKVRLTEGDGKMTDKKTAVRLTSGQFQPHAAECAPTEHEQVRQIDEISLGGSSRVEQTPNHSDVSITRDQRGMTPLQSAVAASDLRAIITLVDEGAPLDHADDNGNTLLHDALSTGDLHVFEYLVELMCTQLPYDSPFISDRQYFYRKGRSHSSSSSSSSTDASVHVVIHTAATTPKEHRQRILSLVTVPPSDDGRPNGELYLTPIHFAAESEMIDFCRYMLSLKGVSINVNSRDQYGTTPLHLAVSRNNIDLVRMLLFHGADVNCVSVNYIYLHKDCGTFGTPLQTACNLGHFEIVKVLLSHPDIDVALVDKSKGPGRGRNIFHCAVSHEKPERSLLTLKFLADYCRTKPPTFEPRREIGDSLNEEMSSFTQTGKTSSLHPSSLLEELINRRSNYLPISHGVRTIFGGAGTPMTLAIVKPDRHIDITRHNAEVNEHCQALTTFLLDNGARPLESLPPAIGVPERGYSDVDSEGETSCSDGCESDNDTACTPITQCTFSTDFTTLEIAVYNARTEDDMCLIRYFLSSDVATNFVKSKHFPLMYEAIASNKPWVIRAFVEAGYNLTANVFEHDYEGGKKCFHLPSLYLALKRCPIATVELLLQLGAPVTGASVVNYVNPTVLEQHLPIIWLLKHWHTATDGLKKLRLLLANGASVGPHNIQNYEEVLVAALRKLRADELTGSNRVRWNELVEGLKLLLDAGVDVPPTILDEIEATNFLFQDASSSRQSSRRPIRYVRARVRPSDDPMVVTIMRHEIGE